MEIPRESCYYIQSYNGKLQSTEGLSIFLNVMQGVVIFSCKQLRASIAETQLIRNWDLHNPRSRVF